MLDLKALEAKVDATLASETPESLIAWLDNYRREQSLLQSYSEKELSTLFAAPLRTVFAPNKAAHYAFDFSVIEPNTAPSDSCNYKIAA